MSSIPAAAAPAPSARETLDLACRAFDEHTIAIATPKR